VTTQASTRSALIEGTIECLRRRGYARTTARDIASASGANLALIGYYFGSKDALLTAALIEVFTRWSDRLTRVTVAPGGDLLTSLRLAAHELDHAFATDRQLLAAFIEALAQAEHSDALRQQLADGYEALRVKTAEALGRFGLGDERAIASMLMAVVDGLMIQHLLDGERTPGAGTIVAGLAGKLESP
jgi:AcrR family transcriptional regulator